MSKCSFKNYILLNNIMEDMHNIANSLSRKGRGLGEYRIGHPGATDILKRVVNKYVTPEQQEQKLFSINFVNLSGMPSNCDYLSSSPDSTPRYTSSPISVSALCCDAISYDTAFSQRNVGITPQ